MNLAARRQSALPDVTAPLLLHRRTAICFKAAQKTATYRSLRSLTGSTNAIGRQAIKQKGHSVQVPSTTARGPFARSVRARPPHRRAKAMQVPSILQGESRTRLLQGIAIGAVASLAIGFSWGGWLTGGAATRLANERADSAVVVALTPVCMEKFLQNSDAQANLAVLQKISTNWEQGDYVVKGGWATQPGATSADYHLARACAEKLVQIKTAAQ